MNEVLLAKRNDKWEADINRRLDVEKSKDYYYDKQEGYLLAVLEENYPNSYKDMKPFCDYLNLTKSVTDQLSVLFESPPEVSLEKEGKLAVNFNDMVLESKLYPTLQKVNKYVNLTRKVGVMPHYDGKTSLEIITADKVFVEQDPMIPTKANAVWVQIGIVTDTPHESDQVNKYIRWTAQTQQVIIVDNQSGLIKETLKENPNPYGRIPIVWFTDDIEEDSFWFDSENYIVEKNEIFNQDLTALRFGATLQSFSTLVL